MFTNFLNYIKLQLQEVEQHLVLAFRQETRTSESLIRADLAEMRRILVRLDKQVNETG